MEVSGSRYVSVSTPPRVEVPGGKCVSVLTFPVVEVTGSESVVVSTPPGVEVEVRLPVTEFDAETDELVVFVQVEQSEMCVEAVPVTVDSPVRLVAWSVEESVVVVTEVGEPVELVTEVENDEEEVVEVERVVSDDTSVVVGSTEVDEALDEDRTVDVASVWGVVVVLY